MARTKIQVGVRFDPELVERLRNAVWHVGKGHTVNSVIEAATWKALEELEAQNGGRRFPPRGGPLPKGTE